MLELSGMQSTSSLPSLPGSTLARSDSIWLGPIYGSNGTKLFNVKVILVEQ